MQGRSRDNNVKFHLAGFSLFAKFGHRRTDDDDDANNSVNQFRLKTIDFKIWSSFDFAGPQASHGVVDHGSWASRLCVFTNRHHGFDEPCL